MKTMLRMVDKIYSKGIAAYSVVVLLVVMIGISIPTTIGNIGTVFTKVSSELTMPLDIKLDDSLVLATVKNFDGVSDELFESKVNELTDDQLSYVKRSGYTIYVIKHFDHLGSDAALMAQANGESVFVEESNKTIWCYELAPKGEFGQVIDQFVDNQRLDIQNK